MQAAIKSAIDAMASNVERSGALHFLAEQMERLLRDSANAEAGREARLIRLGLTRRWGKLALAEESVQSAALAAAAPRRALVIDDRLPVNDRDAGSDAILSHMRALRALGFDVSFVAATSMAGDETASAALEGRGIHHWRLPYYASVEEVLQRQAGCFDLIYIHRAPNAARYLGLASHHSSRARIIYSVADLHFLRLARQARVERRPRLAALSARLRQIELMAAAHAHAVITHSTFEAQFLRQAVPGVNVHVVPWTVPMRPAPKAWESRRGVAFIGSFDHTPNVDAAIFLVEKIMPIVWRSAPDLPCLLVGSGPSSGIERLASDTVQVLGHVPQLGEVFDRVRLTVAPLRYGAGVKGKVLDSLAAGVPCVLSPTSAEGIPLPESLANSIATNIEAFAVQILRLHDDPVAAANAAQAGRELIDERYSSEVVIELLRAVVEGRRAVLA
jgi:glycosyltransferase involved in cell wall biosynthesis